MKKFYLIAGLLIFGFILGKSSSSNTAGISTERKLLPTAQIIEISLTPEPPKAAINIPTEEPTITLQPTATAIPISQPTATPMPTVTSIPTIFIPTQIPPTQYIAPTTAQTNNGLSNNNYYTNVDGNQIHSPANSNSVPSGATARCKDGTYSFSQHRQGTCSSHGGVAEWL